jgi:hypothetical protein
VDDPGGEVCLAAVKMGHPSVIFSIDAQKTSPPKSQFSTARHHRPFHEPNLAFFGNL